MKFSRFSDEETCSRVVQRSSRDFACLRTNGHAGDCIPEANLAGDADGVRWCCRVPLAQPHTDWCPVKQIDEEQLTVIENLAQYPGLGATAYYTRLLVREVRHHRIIINSLDELALSLEHGDHPDQRKLGRELRKLLETRTPP